MTAAPSLYSRYKELTVSRACLVEALRPLAALAEHYRDFDAAPDTADMTQLGEYISVADVRRARAALAAAGEQTR